MIRGFTLRMSSTSTWRRLRAPGRRLVRNTSAFLTSRWRISSPSGTSSASPMLRLLWLGCSMSGANGPPEDMDPTVNRPRCASPLSACSTLMTSAPHSARTAPAAGTNVYWATSTTRTPCIGWEAIRSSSPSVLGVVLATLRRRPSRSRAWPRNGPATPLGTRCRSRRRAPGRAARRRWPARAWDRGERDPSGRSGRHSAN